MEKSRARMLILGIETSCDETAVALVNDQKQIVGHKLYSQIKTHEIYGGVVPEIAARAHLETLPLLLQDLLHETNTSLKDIDAYAATCGPGLIGGVHVGASTAKTLALCAEKPFIAVNHLAAHALVARLSHDVPFPFLLLLASGGHCQILLVHSPVDFHLLGQTLDDAAGETLDKIGRIMGLPYPAGAAIEKLALTGNPNVYPLPRPLLHDKEKLCDFSFSGLKTAARVILEKNPEYNPNDMAASLQQAISDLCAGKIKNALTLCRAKKIHLSHVVFSGGVAANQKIRHDLHRICQDFETTLVAPPPSLCTDNGVMIAWTGIEMLTLGISHSMDFQPCPRWPLEELRITT